MQKDYELRQSKKYKSSNKCEVDLENPPLPEHHRFNKLYCPVCTREHCEKDCDKSGGRGDKWSCKGTADFHWSTMGTSGQAFLKGRAKRMAKFRQSERDGTKYTGAKEQEDVILEEVIHIPLEKPKTIAPVEDPWSKMILKPKTPSPVLSQSKQASWINQLKEPVEVAPTPRSAITQFFRSNSSSRATAPADEESITNTRNLQFIKSLYNWE